MKMQFSLRRFGMLFRKHTAEHLKYYLMSSAVLIGVMVMIFGFFINVQQQPLEAKEQGLIFLFLLLAAGSIFTSTVFADLGDKKRAIASLTLPASHFEKYLVGWLYSYLIFQVVFITCFYLVVNVMVRLDDWHGREIEVFNIFSKENKDAVLNYLIIYMLLHSIAFVGSIFFEKWQFIKSAFAFFLIVGVLVLVNSIFLKVLLGKDIGNAAPFSTISFMEGDNLFRLHVKEEILNMIFFLPMIVALLLWISSYFRLKEKEI